MINGNYNLIIMHKFSINVMAKRIGDNAFLGMYISHAYGYPLQDYKIRNMHWGVPIGLVKGLQHFHDFSSSNSG